MTTTTAATPQPDPQILTSTLGADQTAFVRVLRVRRDFVEFSFAVGDPDLAVELVLPYAAFRELCARYHVTHLEADPSVALSLTELERRLTK